MEGPDGDPRFEEIARLHYLLGELRAVVTVVEEMCPDSRVLIERLHSLANHVRSIQGDVQVPTPTSSDLRMKVVYALAELQTIQVLVRAMLPEDQNVIGACMKAVKEMSAVLTLLDKAS